MGSSLLDFSGYNSLLYSNGQSTSYYGPDDAYLGGGDPGFSPLPGRRNVHHHHHHHHPSQNHPNHPNHPNQQQGGQSNVAGANNNITQTRQLNNRYIVHDRNSLPRLEAEKTFQDRRKQQIANFGATWLKPPGLPKTLYQLREECREQEEQAEQERRDELAQQLARAEAAAAAEAGEGAAGGDMTGEPGGATDLMDNQDGAAVAGLDTDMMEDGREDGEGEGEEEDDEVDLDNEVPDGDGEDFSFGNNNDDSDDPFASSSDEDEDEDADEDADEDEDEGDEENDDDADAGPGRTHDTSIASIASIDGTTRTSGDDGLSTPGGAGRIATPQQRHRASAATATPMRTIEEQREQARARAAERREMRQMRAAEDRMRAMRAHPRLSGLGMGMNMYGEDDDLDEEDQAQMLQEDDLVRDPGPPSQPSHQRQQQQQQQQHHQQYHYSQQQQQNVGPHSDDNTGDGHYYHYGTDDGIAYDEDGHPIHHDDDLEMDMDADLDGDIPEDSSGLGGLGGRHSLGEGGVMDLSSSAFEGGYEHTDTEAEMSSSVVGAGDHIRRAGVRRSGAIDDDDDDDDIDLPPRGFLTPAGGIEGVPSSAAAPAAPGTGGRRFHRNVGRGNNSSLDISSLLSGDGSSNIGSSPQARRR
ncbi:hypothetical protein F503_04405 [Ophiostoma piceae UAMH 11346]|uniref:Uncharacterized protein n=1 Tax=Ophiostoma piceae (strain UAMH 11346) TaxID=1262450 RepID=S3CQF3_OPHP1|nr:hypothetical protein F503_04405 [Ophiostoma piceae UAMH 11346]